MAPCSFVVFPFLKTRGPASIGGITFRSTDDATSLNHEQAEQLGEINDMLFLKDDLRVRTASYATVPYIDLSDPNSDLADLVRIHSFVAYTYASPHEVFGNPFLSTEHSSVVILSPGPVSIFLVRPDHHVITLGQSSALVPDKSHAVPGYSALFNFQHHFWVAKGSRIYGPIPQLTLNISQDLQTLAPAARPDLRLLARALSRSLTATSDRVLTAVRWFNRANEEAHDEPMAIVSLAIAFESLLGLPDTEKKTERLTDAIALLLGRVPRLDSWARQFYQTRSEIVHEGRARNLSFVATDARTTSGGPLYHSLLSYGRQIFQLCVGAVLAGAEMAERAGLEDKLVTNQERFDHICKLLSDPSAHATEKLSRITPIVELIDRYRFVAETGWKIDALLGAVRLAATSLLSGESALGPELTGLLRQLVAAKRTADYFEQLTALEGLQGWSSAHRADAQSEHMFQGLATVLRLADTVWSYVFRHYYWLKDRRAAEGGGTSASPTAK